MAPVVRLSAFLERGLASKPDKLALAGARRRWSWRELEAASRHYGQHLLAAGLRRGDLVASLMPEGDALVVHYLGCLRAGLVATPLNFRYTPPEIDHALRVSGARLLVFDRSRSADVASSERAGALELGTVVDGDGPAGRRFDDLLAAPADPSPLSTAEPGAPAVLFFTSGSTGPAKGVTHTVRSIEAVVAWWAEACAITPDDVVATFASLSHIGGFSDLFIGLSRGAPVVIPERVEVGCQLRLIREHRPTYAVFLTSNLFSLVRDKRTEAGDFASFRLFAASGDRVPAALQDELRALIGREVNECFGATEIGTATLSPLGDEPRRGSVGRALAGYELEVRDGDGAAVAPGVSGRLWVRSGAVMAGYWNDPDSTRAVLVDGWFDTGDVFVKDADGYLWFQGRAKQIIVHRGSNIAPQEVEDALMQHPAVLLVGVVGVPDLLNGENVRAFVTVKPGAAAPAPGDLIAFARARVGYKAPADVVVTERMPLNASGKIDRVQLRRLSDRIGASSLSVTPS